MNAPVREFAPRRELTLPIWPFDEQPRTALARGEWCLAAALFAVSLGYATVRYNLFKGVPWSDWPAYVVNKGLAVASLLTMVAAVWRWHRRSGTTSVLLPVAGALALAHTLLSFALLRPEYYERLFASSKLTMAAGLSLTFGVAAMVAMDLGARKAKQWSKLVRVRALVLIAFASGLHAALPASGSWLNPSGWPGGLPPLTLISFIAGLTALAAWPKTLKT